MGGIGSERQVSLQSGANIARALRQAGLNIVESDITPQNLNILDDKTIDLFFPALHGQFGEDGQLQSLMEHRGLVYVGSDSRASRLAFDKIASKDAFRAAGVRVADDISITSPHDLEGLVERLAKVGDKFVVKPIKQGSSVGVEILEGPDSVARAAENCLRQYGDCMVEKFVAGREITIGIVNRRTLPIIEIRSKVQFYDYNAKYLDDATEYLFDTIDDEGIVARLQQTAMKCFDAVRCRHLGRVDMIIDNDDREFVLEINTLPGFTGHSLLPMAAARTGLSACRLCVQIVDAALNDAAKK